MKSFIKENFVLILGVTLPLLLAVGFLLATKISVLGIDPPKTSVLYYYQSYHLQNEVLKVKDGKVYLLPKKRPYDDGVIEPVLYLYNPVTGENRKISLPEYTKADEGQEILIDEIKDMYVSKEKDSPDGFTFTNKYYGYRGGLVFEIFGGSGNRGNNNYLVKDTLNVPLPMTDDHRYEYGQFLGWVVSE